jgi:hypothetical protein
VNRIKRLRRFDVPGLQPAPRSYAFSRNGKLLAVVVRDDHAAGDLPGRLEVYDVATGALTRKITIDELQWNAQIRPSGVSFNDEADKIAVLFEHQGQGLFLCWDAKGEIPIHQHVYPGGLLPQGVDVHGFQGPAFTLVDNGRAWLIYGASVFDSKSGLLLGDLKIKNVASQLAISPDTLLMMQRGNSGKNSLLQVRLDVNRARQVAANP